MQISESEVVFSQYAQDPDEEYYEMLRNEPEQSNKQAVKEKTCKQRCKPKIKKQKPTKSFVMSRLQRQGIKLIKISVIDLCNNNNNNSQTSDCDSDNENVVLNAQYIVKDALDYVMDDTEALIKKISKTLVDADF